MATEILRPTAAGDETNLTSSDGANWAMVDEAVADDATTTVRTGQQSYIRDLYNLGNITDADILAGGTINSATITIRCFSSGGTAYAKTAIKTGGTVYLGAENSVPGAWTEYTTVYATNPQLSAVWTIEALNALQAGVTLQAGIAEDTYCTQVFVTIDYTAPAAFVPRALFID